MEEGNTSSSVSTQSIPPISKPPSRFKTFLKKYRRQLLIGTPIVLVVIAAAIIWFVNTGSKNQTVASVNTTPKATTPKVVVPTTVADPLTGTLVSPDDAKQPVLGVMIENLYPDARPQSGLSQAGVVYEALAEGGITRFLAIFQEPFPTSVGPVRSLRPYYLDWGLEYNIPVSHAGGSQPALSQIGPTGLKNLDALSNAANFFFRTSDRAAPHNLYSNQTDLANMLTHFGYDTAPTFTSWARKDDTKTPAGVTAPNTDIHITFSTDSSYNVEYKFDTANDVYDRFEGGVAQVDRNTDNQITVKNVVVELAPVSYGTQQDGKPETDYNLIGSGKVLVFEDGGVTIGTWSKTSASSPTTFTDTTGQAVKFNRGNTWISVIPNTETVSY